MFETLLGGVFGGVLRLAPEVFKLFDKKNERAHELKMIEAEMEFAKIRGEIAMRQVEATMTMAEMDVIDAIMTTRAMRRFMALYCSSRLCGLRPLSPKRLPRPRDHPPPASKTGVVSSSLDLSCVLRSFASLVVS